jgi:hypothetical protein
MEDAPCAVLPLPRKSPFSMNNLAPGGLHSTSREGTMPGRVAQAAFSGLAGLDRPLRIQQSPTFRAADEPEREAR